MAYFSWNKVVQSNREI